MKKMLSVLLIIFLTITAFTGCGSKTEPAEIEPAPAETQEATEPDTEPETTTESPSEELGPKLSGAIVDLMKSGTYLMKYKTTMEFEGKSMEADVTFAVDGDKTVSVNKGDGFESTMIMRDDRMYMIDHSQKMIMEMAIPEDPDAVVEKVDTTAITFVGRGVEDGLDYEEYSIMNGTIRYYFDKNELVKIVSTTEGVTSTMTIEEISDTVSDDLFEIPTDYQKINI
ncbi:LptM family lipoprotein [Acidaminobacter hydrogenoformans]|uniref:Outer membrane lipoprotein-sorting protein n=1 Tax=Acidaminobacter hydrogenoformans DSM 2784 TaxID=1120920 RepID=A0A1G5S6S9_9FIRM|nr:hypothetical protein [Acidaminobacter hydrogenoformans]SCZ81817.1 hypothetical protein SAMN03080599_03061 [Acidaminobacter hydrogenoformans DSM 2784]